MAKKTRATVESEPSEPKTDEQNPENQSKGEDMVESEPSKPKTDEQNPENQSTGDEIGDRIEKMLGNIFAATIEGNESLTKGLENLNDIPDFGLDLPPVGGRKVELGIMGLSPGLKIVIACGKAQVRYLDLAQFVAIIENAKEPGNANSIMLQNFRDEDKYGSSAKGQILARLNIKSSAIHVIQGLTGRVIRTPSDFALFDVYFLNRVDLTSYYLSARRNLANDDKLATMIQANDGWKALSVPLDPLMPFGE